jgi:hypothetical protein
LEPSRAVRAWFPGVKKVTAFEAVPETRGSKPGGGAELSLEWRVTLSFTDETTLK